jgi:hypothetical protein
MLSSRALLFSLLLATGGPTAGLAVPSALRSGERSAGPTQIEYRVLATNKTSTMGKELNEAAEAGYRFKGVMGGETSWEARRHSGARKS